ncbi:hypothetical protein BDZ91DRAFT_728612 [Kalaharituber pfeilii]|nr:hypothetical protein BDZ91DRAFT_728612 [Kalaharituber pfeilii]
MTFIASSQTCSIVDFRLLNFIVIRSTTFWILCCPPVFMSISRVSCNFSANMRNDEVLRGERSAV